MENIIPTEVAKTLDGLFSERVRRSPRMIAYRSYNQIAGNWRDHTWEQMEREVARWQTALTKEGLVTGDRVAVMSRNCPEWVIFDQAALGLGLVVVPLYTEDSAENAAYILGDSGARLLLLEDREQWQSLEKLRVQMSALFRIVTINSFENCTKEAMDSVIYYLTYLNT